MNHFRGNVSAVSPRGLKCSTISNSTRGQILPHVASATTANVIRVPTCHKMSRAVANYGRRGRKGRVSREGMYGSCPLFGRENCMSVYATEFPGLRAGCISQRRQKRRTVLRCIPTPPGRFVSLANAHSLSPRGRIAEYVLHMHSFINLHRDTASSDTWTRALKRSQEICL